MLPIVVMTAWGSVDLAVEAMRQGANDFVQKPWDNSRLLTILRTQGFCSMKGVCQEQTSPRPSASMFFFDSQPSTYSSARRHTSGAGTETVADLDPCATYGLFLFKHTRVEPQRQPVFYLRLRPQAFAYSFFWSSEVAYRCNRNLPACMTLTSHVHTTRRYSTSNLYETDSLLMAF
jgi:predicted ATPase